MSYIKNIIATELQQDKSITLSARWVLGRIGGLTQKGKKCCCTSNEFLANECGLSKRTIQKALDELISKRIIDTKITLDKGRKVRIINLIYQPTQER